MFSDHLRKPDESPVKILLFIAGCLVIACQLVAMVLVTGEQVEKAQLREASQSNARAAMAGCIESSRGAALRDCELTSKSFEVVEGAYQANPTSQGINLVTLSNR